MAEEKRDAGFLPGWVLRHRVASAVALVASVLLISLVVAGCAMASRYQPIDLDANLTPPAVVDAHGIPVPGSVKDVPGMSFADPPPTVTSTDPNMTVSVLYQIGNHGRFAVQVLDIDTPFGARAPRLRVLMGDAHGSPPKQPFRKFTLHHGDIRLLTVELRPRICPGPDGKDGVAVAKAQNVTYRSLGMTHHALVTFQGAGYGITGIVSC